MAEIMYRPKQLEALNIVKDYLRKIKAVDRILGDIQAGKPIRIYSKKGDTVELSLDMNSRSEALMRKQRRSFEKMILLTVEKFNIRLSLKEELLLKGEASEIIENENDLA